MAVASPSVIKLEGQRNWSVWKFQVTVTLKGVDVFSVIDGTFVESETGDKTAWVKKDVKAQSIIVSRLSEEAMIHVLTCETAAEMWKKLHSVFESKSATSTLMLQQRFLQCKFEEGELSIYLAKLQEMACQLKQAGETVSEKFLMTKVLMSLPESYSHFVSAWESVDTDKQNFNDLVARLLVEEERIQSKGHESESTALFLKKSGFVKRCNRCYVPGHLAKDCNSKVVLLDMSSEDEEIEQHEESEEEFHDTNTDEGEEQDKTPERTENISERTEEGRNQNETEYQTTGIGSQNSATEDQNQGQRSKRKIIKPNKLEDYYLYVTVEPSNYREAMASPEAENWKEAMRKELNQLKENNTWTEIETVPEGKEVISSKWVLKRKGNDYKASYKTKFEYLSNGCLWGLLLDEELYLSLPEDTEVKIVRLNKSIYGLKRSPKYWNEAFNNVMISMGYKQSDKDYCLYSKCEGKNKTFLLLYVDDILYFGNNKLELSKLRDMLCQTFKMKELSAISKFLGIDVKQDLNSGVTIISQKDYLRNILSEYNMLDCKTLSLPIDKNFNFHILKRENSESVFIENKCRRLIGRLMYAAMGTRPDICAVVNILSRYQNSASTLLYKILLNILRYLKGTLDLCLKYYRDSNVDEIIGYVDSDWGGCNDRKSTTGCIFKVFGSSVMWFSKKQATVSLSSTEAEFIALCSATSEACWLKDILFIFGFDIKIVIFEDNQSTIKMAQMATGNSRVKHLEIKLSFVKEKLDKNIIELRYINTSDQLADILTKALGGTLFRKLRDRLFSK
ncbi:unnamed protein product [Euphydryas editha]|uniref:CCHC-type domain-containing protein n=1 Tax=Euphydryas editha TaxID=104508 RepID=A0AAU9URL1_EUPED|nr:unnamed protein product [Euphydryas editha]